MLLEPARGFIVFEIPHQGSSVQEADGRDVERRHEGSF
jgi:hypothetical protein